MPLPVALRGFDELLDLVLGEVFACPVFGIGSPSSENCLFFAGWHYQPQCWISHVNSPVLVVLCMLKAHFMDRSVPSLVAEQECTVKRCGSDPAQEPMPPWNPGQDGCGLVLPSDSK